MQSFTQILAHNICKISLNSCYFRNMVSGWIGFNDRTNENSFTWVGAGPNVGYKNFQPGEPSGDGDCVEIIPAQKYSVNWMGKWNDESCASKSPFICERGRSEFYFWLILISYWLNIITPFTCFLISEGFALKIFTVY